MPFIGPTRLRSGGILQSGIPKIPKGLVEPFHGLVRGVVVATYVTDATDHPLKKIGITPASVWCDVLAVGNFNGGSRFFFLPGCQVAQPLGGMHKGVVFKPRAATRLINGQPLSSVKPQDLNQVDGDWVLIQFADGKTNQPIITASLPHPSRDMGDPETYPIGKRQRMKLVDGDPMFFLQHGSFFGVDNDGGFVADTTLANSGQLGPTSAEVPTGPANGNIALKMPQTATFSVALCQSAAAGMQVALTTLSLVKGSQVLNTGPQNPDFQIKCDAGNSLAVSGAQAGAALRLGDGAFHVALAEPMQAWWASVKAWLDSHTHASTGPVPGFTGPVSPTPLTQSPAYSDAITSGAVSVPSRSL